MLNRLKNVAEKDLKRMQMSIHQINDYKSNVCGQHKNISTKWLKHFIQHINLGWVCDVDSVSA